MKLSTATVEVADNSASNGSGQDTALCEFDAEGTAHLMRTLSDLYSNGPAAVLREYSVNAYDSHIEAGNTEPIEVTLPNELNPTLVITDHGVGLSRDEMINIFSRYGASTKRGTDTQVGAFGLGTKSAFTLGSQFLVTGVKDGMRTVAAFSLNAEGVGTVTILDHGPTTERNGVTVSISIQDVAAVQRAAGPVFSTWTPGTVLVNGERPRSVLDEPTEIAEGLYLVDNVDGDDEAWGSASLVVVMGGVGYPVSRDLAAQLSQRLWYSECRAAARALCERNYSEQRVYCFVDIGDVDIAPSREELRDTPRTLDRLTRIAEDYTVGVEATVRREIDAAPTLTAAVRTITALARSSRLMERLREMDVTWRGQLIAEKVHVPWPASIYSTGGDRCTHEHAGVTLSADGPLLDRILVVTDIPEGAAQAAMRKAKTFLAAVDTYQCLIFVPAGAESVEWFAFGTPDTFPTLTFEDYLAQAKQRRRPPEKTDREPLRYRVRPDSSASTTKKLTAEEIADLDQSVLVVRKLDDLPYGPVRHQSFTQKVIDGMAVVELGGGRTVAALRRRIGENVSVSTWEERADAVAAEVAASLTDADRELERVQAHADPGSSYSLACLFGLRGGITNAAFLDRLDLMRRAENLSAEEKHRLAVLTEARKRKPELFPQLGQDTNLFGAYPLLWSIRYHEPSPRECDHIVAYVNALG